MRFTRARGNYTYRIAEGLARATPSERDTGGEYGFLAEWAFAGMRLA